MSKPLPAPDTLAAGLAPLAQPVQRTVLHEVREAWWDLTALLGVQSIAFLFSVAYLSLLSRALGPAGLGSVALFLSVVNLVFNLTISWGQGAIVRFGKEELLKTGRIAEAFWARQVLMLAGIALGALVFIAGRPMIQHHLGPAAGAFEWMLLPFLLLYGYADLGAWTLQAIGKMRHYAAGLLARQVILCAGAILMVSGFLSPSIGTAFGVEFAGHLGLLLFAAPAFNPRLLMPVRVRLRQVQAIWNYSWLIIVSMVGGYLINWFHVGLIYHQFGTAEVGVYQAGFRITFLLAEALGTVSTVLFPLVVALGAHASYDMLREFYVNRLIPQLSLLWGLATLVIMVLVPDLLVALFGAEYRDSASLVMTLMSGVGFQMVGVLYSVIFSVYGRFGPPVLIGLLAGVLNAVGLILVVPRWGLIGAAWVSACCAIASKIAYVSEGNRLVGASTWTALLGPCGAALVVMAIGPHASFTTRAVGAAIGIATLCLFARRTRLFHIEDLQRFNAVAMPQAIRRLCFVVYRGLSPSAAVATAPPETGRTSAVDGGLCSPQSLMPARAERIPNGSGWYCLVDRAKDHLTSGWIARDLDRYVAGYSLHPVALEACLVLRHDLDGMNSESIDRLMQVERAQGIRSTCFALQHHLQDSSEALRRLRDGGWDLQCHSQARDLIVEIDDARWFEWRYRSNLRRSLRHWRRMGWPSDGHAPHGLHAQLGLDPNGTWDVIEAATIDSGFSWVSSYRAIVKTAFGQSFPKPSVCYFRQHLRSGRRVLVFPTAWDDRFFFPGWEDRMMGRPARTLEEAQASLLQQLIECERLQMPCVVSLHPNCWLGQGPVFYPAHFQEWIVTICRQRGVPVRTLSELAAQAVDRASWRRTG